MKQIRCYVLFHLLRLSSSSILCNGVISPTMNSTKSRMDTSWSGQNLVQLDGAAKPAQATFRPKFIVFWINLILRVSIQICKWINFLDLLPRGRNVKYSIWTLLVGAGILLQSKWILQICFSCTPWVEIILQDFFRWKTRGLNCWLELSVFNRSRDDGWNDMCRSGQRLSCWLQSWRKW